MTFDYLDPESAILRAIEILESFKHVSRTQRLRYALQLAEGVADLHALGVVHRDVKPANAIVRASTDSVVLVDHGIAKAQDDPTLTEIGDQAFSKRYAAPDQMRDASQEHKEDDMYALGLSIFEIVECQLPFEGVNALDLFEKKKQALNIGDLDSRDPILARLIRQMTDPNRAGRPSVSAVLEGLRPLAV